MATAWRGRLAAFGDAVRFARPASAAALSALEEALGTAVPDELGALLRESDGLTDRYGGRVVWPAVEMARQNRDFRTRRELRTLYMPFDSVLFFGEAGNGDRFFYRMLDGRVRDPDIYVRDHETNSRTWRAARLDAFLSAMLEEAIEE
jgi:SMI1-KNR4 cell-wall